MSNFAPILQLIPSSETPVGGNDVYITHQDTSNNEPMVNQLFENAILWLFLSSSVLSNSILSVLN